MPTQIEDIIGFAVANSIADLFSDQPDILTYTKDTSETEWNLTNHLACKIHKYFMWLSIDTELKKDYCDGNRPDIVIHKRGTHNINYLVIEVKHRGSDNSEDIKKIKEKWMVGKLSYEFGCAVRIMGDLSFEVNLFHKESQQMYRDSIRKVIPPRDISEFRNLIEELKNKKDMEKLNQFVEEHYKLTL